MLQEEVEYAKYESRYREELVWEESVNTWYF